MSPPDFSGVLTLRGAVIAALSDDDFFELCQANELLHLERNVHRELLIKLLPGWDISQCSGQVLGQLANWRRAHGGYALSWAGYNLPDGSVLGPALSWMSAAAYATLTPAQRQKFPPLCPEFVVELKTAADYLAGAQAKMMQWLANGVQLGFLLDVQAETAYIYRPGQAAEILTGFDRELGGEPLLPGFRLDLRELREPAA